MNFIEVMERVSIVVEKELGMKPTDSLIAKYLDISPTNYANMKTRNRIPYEEISYFCSLKKVSINWVLFNQRCESLVAEEEKYYSLRVIDKINASCGGGAYEEDNISVKYVNIEKEILSKIGYISTCNLEAIRVFGDSMYPTLKEDELILIDRASNKYNEENIFLVNTTNGLFVKRLKIYDEDKIDLISDNKDYTNYTFSIDEVTILGRVLGVLDLVDNQLTMMNTNGLDKNMKNSPKKDIEFSTAYIELIDGKYKFFTPDEDSKDGYEAYTDEPLYNLERNQFHAIIINCEVYDELLGNSILEIESSNCILLPNSHTKDDEYAFLFEEYHSYLYERDKLETVKNHTFE